MHAAVTTLFFTPKKLHKYDVLHSGTPPRHWPEQAAIMKAMTMNA